MNLLLETIVDCAVFSLNVGFMISHFVSVVMYNALYHWHIL